MPTLDQFHLSQYFFQSWTQEHTGYLVVFIIILLVMIFRPGKGAR